MAHDFEKKWRSKDVLVLENVDFSSMLLCDRVLAGLAKAGFKKPSPIQLEAIPTGRFGKDLLVQAKSGTGKTLVFVIVALEMFRQKMFLPQVLILVPTREIATQICSVVKSVGSYFPKLTCESFIGGFPVADDVKKARYCQIVVGTPGRLKQLIEMKALSTKSIRLIVFDEADEVLSISWLEDIDFIFNSLPEDKQVIATSATYPPKLKKIIIKYLRDPYLAQINSKKLALLGIIHYIKVVESSAMAIKQYRFKLAALESILKKIKFTQCLVYCNGIYKVETLYRDIKKWGFSTTYISSNRDQAERLRAIDCLKRFKCKVLVSSNVTARGIDAENVDLVINFDVSNYTETYLHRSGRAGRYGTKGATISIVDLFELKLIEKIEKEAHFKSYELPDPVPTDLIQNPVLDNYAIEVNNILKNSDEITEEQLLSLSWNCYRSETNSAQSSNPPNSVSVNITDGNEVNSEKLNEAPIATHEEACFFTKKNSTNYLSNDEQSQNNLKNCVVNSKSDDNNIHVKIVDKLDGEKSENATYEDTNMLNLSGENNPNDFESNINVSTMKNGIIDVLGDSKNAKSPDTSNDTSKINISMNECYDTENAESLTNGENNLVGTDENSGVIIIKNSAHALNECRISEVASIRDSGKNMVHTSEKSSHMNSIESSLLSVSEEIVEKSSIGDNLICYSTNSEVACAKDNLDNLNENSCDINIQQDYSSNLQTSEVPSINDLDKNEIIMAVENYIQKYENMELSVSRHGEDSLESKNFTSENSVCKNISLNYISDLNSRRSDYCYKVFKLFQKGNSSKQIESEKETLNKAEDSSAEKQNCIQKPIFCTEVSSVKKHSTTLIFSNETASKNELKFENALQIPDTLIQQVAIENNDENIPNFHKSLCLESTPHFEISKHKDTHLLDRGATESTERNIMSFFDEVSNVSSSETEPYCDPSSQPSSYSESVSDSCTGSSSSSQLILSSTDDDSYDQGITETSSPESHSSMDSLSVHNIEYSGRKDMKSLEKYHHSTVLKQEKATLKKHQQICHSRCSDKRQLCHSTHQNLNYSNDFSNNLLHSLDANYSNAYEKPNQFSYSKVHHASSNGQHFNCKKSNNVLKNKNNFLKFSCNGQHSPACFVPSEHRCHPYHDSTPCNQRSICDQWYQMFCYQWQHIQKCSNLSF